MSRSQNYRNFLTTKLYTKKQFIQLFKVEIWRQYLRTLERPNFKKLEKFDINLFISSALKNQEFLTNPKRC